MKHYQFLNSITGKKFKTTETGKRAVLAHPQLKKTCKLIGECDEKGFLIGKDTSEKLPNRTVDSIKEIMEKNKEPLKRKYNVKEK